MPCLFSLTPHVFLYILALHLQCRLEKSPSLIFALNSFWYYKKVQGFPLGHGADRWHLGGGGSVPGRVQLQLRLQLGLGSDPWARKSTCCGAAKGKK